MRNVNLRKSFSTTFLFYIQVYWKPPLLFNCNRYTDAFFSRIFVKILEIFNILIKLIFKNMMNFKKFAIGR